MKKQNGFTLLIAALVASIVLSLGASIFSIAKKQLALSSTSRESQFAFYTADSAAECALYWDVRHNFFGTTTPIDVISPAPKCDGVSLVPLGSSDFNSQRPPAGSLNPYPYMMYFQSSLGGQCEQVEVKKTQNSVTGVISTNIYADGFNVDCASIETSKKSLVRSVELSY